VSCPNGSNEPLTGHLAVCGCASLAITSGLSTNSTALKRESLLGDKLDQSTGMMPAASGTGRYRGDDLHIADSCQQDWVLTSFDVKPLDQTTWPDFARLVEKHNGIWGGCWCMSFHLQGGFGNRTAAETKSEKEDRVRSGRAHAALVYDGSAAIGWWQFGPTNELPRIKNKRAYLDGLTDLPEWRITCFFVDRDYRRKGVASVALKGALREIARLGGGTVESYPEDIQGGPASASFLQNGTLFMFEREGFKRSRRLGKNHWVVTKFVRKSSPKRSPVRPSGHRVASMRLRSSVSSASGKFT
jgi:GNAT superfamily N-acetyltransferase